MSSNDNPSHFVLPHASTPRPESPSSGPTINYSSVSRDVTPSSEYHRSAPSPPHLFVPPPTDRAMVLPAFEGITGDEITNEDLRIITQGQHTATERVSTWKYEHRRQAQSIMPFLYLGPFAAVRNREYLRKEQITMLLAVRDTKSAQARLLNADAIAQELGIVSAYIDVSSNQELIAAFPRAISLINDHLLTIYRQQALPSFSSQPGNITVDKANFKAGKVLVYCESGNERSASVVVAYIMAMYGEELVKSIQYVNQSRFCIGFDDGMKEMLGTYRDIVVARRDVFRYVQQTGNLAPAATSLPMTSTQRNKRHFDDVMDEDEQLDECRDDLMEDVGQYASRDSAEGRRNFAPFRDQGV